MIITIDDDNFITNKEDYVGSHVIGEKKLLALTSDSRWFNVCEMLREQSNLPFYHRGYSLEKRWIKAKHTTKVKKGNVVVNAGLWLGAPDIDALTWLDLPIETTGFKKKYPRGIALDIGTWSPFNSQNTALAREVIPAYFLSPHIGRYDDIWASYFVKKITDTLGHYIHFGLPLVEQKRNAHNYFIDFDKERLGMELTPGLTRGLIDLKLKGDNYHDCFGEIIEWLEENKVDIFATKSNSYLKNINKMIEGMSIWHNIYSKL